MYNEEMIVVGKIENGYVIGVRVPYDKNDGDEGCCGSEMKQFFVKDAAEAGQKVAEILPKLQNKMDAEEVFAAAFKEEVDG